MNEVIRLPSGATITLRKPKRKEVIQFNKNLPNSKEIDKMAENMELERLLTLHDDKIIALTVTIFIDGQEKTMNTELLNDMYQEDVMEIIEKINEFISGKKK